MAGVKSFSAESKSAERLAILAAEEEKKEYRRKMESIMERMWKIVKDEDLSVYDVSIMIQSLDRKLKDIQVRQKINILEDGFKDKKEN